MREKALSFARPSQLTLTRNNRAKVIFDEIGKEAFDFISSYSDLQKPGTFVISSEKDMEAQLSFEPKYNCVINLKPIVIREETNHFVKTLNERLGDGGLFIGCFELCTVASVCFVKKTFPFVMDVKRVKLISPMLKFLGIADLEFISKNIVKEKIGFFGRFYYYGFEIISEKKIGNKNYFIARRVKNPSQKPLPSTSPLIKLNRVGKNGKRISIYKLRTMYPYSEYLQEYIYKNNQLEGGGKFKNDYRIIRLGKFLRKYWIDELPMLINLIRGDIKLFGVRPLSEQYFNLYTPELQEFRIKFKPGLIPPYYVDMPDNFDAILRSELSYLKEYECRPIMTDFKYLIKALFNILIRFKRSK